MKSILKITLFSFIALTFASSCEKEEEPTTKVTEPVDSGLVQLSITNKFNGFLLNELFPTTSTTWNDRAIIINNAQIYLSNFQFVNSYTNATFIPSTEFILSKLGGYNYPLGAVPTGTYSNIKLFTGLPSNINDQPSSFSSYLNDPKMWFDTVNHSMKYVFIRITGLVDTSVNKDGNIDAPFDIKIGGEAFHQEVEILNNGVQVGKGTINPMNIDVDFSKIINELDLANPEIRNLNEPLDALRYRNILSANIQAAFQKSSL